MTITIDEYTTFVRARKVYKCERELAIIYPTLGLLGELGELAEKVDDNYDWYFREVSELTPEMVLEAGDVLWYIVAIADDLGLTLHDILYRNERSTLEVSDPREALYYAIVQAALMADKTKKILRDGTPPVLNFYKSKLLDVLLGLKAVMPSVTLEAIMQGNVDKLTARVARGTIHGSGDNR